MANGNGVEISTKFGTIKNFPSAMLGWLAVTVLACIFAWQLLHMVDRNFKDLVGTNKAVVDRLEQLIILHQK